MRRLGAPVLLACALLGLAEPALAQNFFERLFGPPRQPGQPVSPGQPSNNPYLQPRPQYRPDAPPQPQPQRRAPQTQPSQRSSTPSQQAQPAAPVPEPPPAPYEKDLLRLSEIIGALAFLRSICSSPDANEWPQKMQALLEAEGTTPGRRERLAGAYNKGYNAFSLTYRVCTASADEATNRYVQEGDRLAHSIAGRYGG
jgi:uncharacterized protein (TIGR02301 family)